MSISISISNLAKIKKADVKINGLTVISGENDTGKSTVGKAIYSTIKSLNGYKTSGANEIKRAILGRMGDLIRLMGRLIKRRTKKFEEIRKDIFYYIRHDVSYLHGNYIRFVTDNEDDDKEKYEQIITSLDFQKLDVLIKKIDTYAKNNQYWKDNVLKEKIDHLAEVIQTYLSERIRLSTDLYFEFKQCIGGVYINSMHPDDEGKVSLYLQNKEILEMSLNKETILVNKYDEGSFDYIFDDATYIETPLLINEEFNLSFHSRSSFADVVNKIKSAKLPKNEKIKYILDKIPGEISFENGKFLYKVAPSAMELSLSAMASGVKSFNILQLLAQGGYIGGVSKLLIVDEPENHLHPEWQLRYAELIVNLVAEGASVIITSHSPYMIEALYFYAKKKLDESKVAFYYTEKKDKENYTEIKETKDLSIIFDKLSKPLEQLVWD